MTEQLQNYIANHPEILEVYVQGPNGRDLFRPGSVDEPIMSAEYGEVRRAYQVETTSGIKIYGIAEAVSANFHKYDIHFDEGVLKIFGHNGNLIDAFAATQWVRVSGSENI